MPMITDDMHQIIGRAMLCFAATVNADGTPNLSPKASLTVRGDALLFANMASPRTVENLRRNPAIEINVVDVFSRRGYRFAGSAEILAAGDPEFEDMARWVKATNGEIYPVFDVVKVHLASAREIRSPAYTIGRASEAELRPVYQRRYGAAG